MNDLAQIQGKLWSEHFFIKMGFSFLFNFGLIGTCLSQTKKPKNPKHPKKTKIKTKTPHPAAP